MLKTRLTQKLGLDHPIVLAPMAMASGGKLAAAVGRAGGLGLLGGSYCDADWINAQMDAAGNQPVGCGFITWALAQKPDLLSDVLERKPSAIFLSFGDPAPFARQIKAANVPLLCQVQSLRDAAHAIDLGADVIVAQGTEAGGHGASRATMTLVPEIADYIAANAPDTLLCAAGGIADGRGLAATLMLGADGVVIGSGFLAAEETLVHPNMKQAIFSASGDDTIRTSSLDIVRQLDWPEPFNIRVLKNAFTDKWHEDPEGLRAQLPDEIRKWQKAFSSGDADNAPPVVGEAAGLIKEPKPAAQILESMVAEAEQCLTKKFA